jgi:hypothetical protein
MPNKAINRTRTVCSRFAQYSKMYLAAYCSVRFHALANQVNFHFGFGVLLKIAVFVSFGICVNLSINNLVSVLGSNLISAWR